MRTITAIPPARRRPPRPELALRRDTDHVRHLEVEAPALKVVAPPATKSCRACKTEKALDQFARHRLSKDGHRKDCRDCVRARAKAPAPVAAPETRPRSRRSETYLKNNRAAVRAWSARNPEAVVARRKLRRAVRAGRIVPATVCQAAGCTERENLQGHHADYRKALEVAWLCAKHHRRAHRAGIARLKRGVPRKLGRIPRTR